MGASTYDLLRDQGYPYPSTSTLDRHLSDLKMEPGENYEMFDILEPKVKKMKEHEKDCIITFDEMKTKEQIEYDMALKKYVGYATIPPNPKQRKRKKAVAKFAPQDKPLASHLLAYEIAGTTTRWKQVTNFDHTADSFDPTVVVSRLKSMHENARRIGLRPVANICDMSGQNIGI